MSFFKDFYKPAKKLFEDDYQKDALSFTSKTKSTANLSLELVAKKNGDAVDSSLKYSQKQKVQDFDVTVNGKLFNNGNTEADVETELKKHGVVVVVKGGLLAGEDTKDVEQDDSKESKIFRDSVGFEVKYSHKHFKGTVGGDFKRKNVKKFNISGATEYEGFFVGGAAQFNSAQGYKPSSYTWGLGYSKGDFTTILESEESNKFKIAVRQDLNKDLSGAVEFKHDLKKKESNFSTGVQYRIDASQLVKVKVDDAQKVNLGYIVDVNKDLKTLVHLETNLKTLAGTPSPAKVSLGFIYEPK
jgi:hypothetical protein